MTTRLVGTMLVIVMNLASQVDPVAKAEILTFPTFGRVDYYWTPSNTG